MVTHQSQTENIGLGRVCGEGGELVRSRLPGEGLQEARSGKDLSNQGKTPQPAKRGRFKNDKSDLFGQGLFCSVRKHEELPPGHSAHLIHPFQGQEVSRAMQTQSYSRTNPTGKQTSRTGRTNRCPTPPYLTTEHLRNYSNPNSTHRVVTSSWPDPLLPDELAPNFNRSLDTASGRGVSDGTPESEKQLPTYLMQWDRDIHVLLRMDNRSAIAYINHMGGQDHRTCQMQPASYGSGASRGVLR